MTNIKISRRYAKALLALGREDGKYSRYAEELDAFQNLVNGMPELLDALSNPLYPSAMRQKVLDSVIEKAGMSPVVNHFLLLLMKKKRIKYVLDIITSYHHLVDEASNITTAQIVSATELTEDVVQRIQSAVARMTGKNVRLEMRVDPEIIGGIITKVGDMNFDGSVQDSADELERNFEEG